jgi:hypothetical protein
VAQTWPDLPELEGIPEVLRGGIWMKAYSVALRRRKTWVLGLIGLTSLASACALIGHQVAGGIGAILGAMTGAGMGIVFFVRVIIEWQARRSVREVSTTPGSPVGPDRIGS